MLEASRPEMFQRTAEHVKLGTEGKACTCANAVAALDALGGEGWEFTDNRAYKLFANKRGELTHAIVYEHNQGAFQKKYDRRGKRAMLRSPDCEAMVTLNPAPSYSPRKGPRAPYPRTKEDGSITKRRREGAIGSLARLERKGVKV